MSEPKPTLDYQTPAEPVSSATFTGQCVLATLGTSIFAPVVILGLGIGAGALVGNNSGSEGNAVAAAIIAGVIPLVGFLALAVIQLRNPRRRAFGIGMLIGLGIDLLLVGLCFGSLR